MNLTDGLIFLFLFPVASLAFYWMLWRASK